MQQPQQLVSISYFSIINIRFTIPAMSNIKTMIYHCQLQKRLKKLSQTAVYKIVIIKLQLITKNSHMYDSQQQVQDENKKMPQDQQLIPQYGQVQGQVVKLGGLDYTLLQQQKNKEIQTKLNLLDTLKNKINIISGNAVHRTIKDQQSNQKQIYTDHFLKQITKILQPSHDLYLNNQTKKSQKYFQFQLDQFGNRKPIIVQKRIGKISNQPFYVHFDDNFINEFVKLAQIKQKAFINAQRIIDQAANSMQDNNSNDDIFGNDSEPQQKTVPKKPEINIQIGKKLDFGIQQDIFQSQKRMNPITRSFEQQPQQNDKYFFMRKRIKKNEQNIDGYDQCYYQSGPSLKQLVDLKKQGIQYYGDLQEFKQKQKKKPNFNKQYEMVQKIIQRKNHK